MGGSPLSPLEKFPKAAVRSYHKQGKLKQQKWILSQFLRPEVQSQSIGRTMLPLEALRGGSSLAFSGFWWLMAILGVPLLTGASLQPLPPFSHGVCVSLLFSLCKRILLD